MTNYLFQTVEDGYLERPYSITVERFTELLQSKNSPVVPYATDVYNFIVAKNADPSYALAQFRWESQYGTAGYAVSTKSWGNMLYDSNLTLNAVGRYSPGNGYTYAVYDDWMKAIEDYIRYLYDYRDRRKLTSIFTATAEWIGKALDDPWHIEYSNGITVDMARYEWKTKKFVETGDQMIDMSRSFDSASGRVVTQYPLVHGTPLYKGTNGAVLTSAFQGNDTVVWFLGLVNGSTSWGAIKVQTDGKPQEVYIKNIDLNQIIDVRG